MTAGRPTPEPGGEQPAITVTRSGGRGGPHEDRGAGELVFYYDLVSPYSYLAAERISGMFTEAGLSQPEWQPVSLAGLLELVGRSAWHEGPEREAHEAEVERRARGRGMPAVVWPDAWPVDSTTAMRAAVFAKRAGRTVSFSLAAFRQAFAAGRDLSVRDNIWIAGAACELHPRALASGVETRSVTAGLDDATGEAARRGVLGVPSVRVGERVYWGDDRLEEAVGAAADRLR